MVSLTVQQEGRYIDMRQDISQVCFGHRERHRPPPGRMELRHDREVRPRLKHVELRGRSNRPIEILLATTKRICQPEKDPANFLGFLLLEGDDVVVDFNRAQRLEKQTRAAA